MLFRFSITALILMLVGVGLPLQAQEPNSDTPVPPFPDHCELLPLVGGEGSEVSKEISPLSLNLPLPVGRIGTQNNWHTDWYIPAEGYQTYQVTVMPRDNREYDIAMYLKYPDDTDQQFYREQRINLTANEPITIEVTPERSDLLPYQINTNIGGVQAVGASYTVVAAGCR
jgi:hypothetical protein